MKLPQIFHEKSPIYHFKTNRSNLQMPYILHKCLSNIIMVSTKLLSSTTVLNIDNNKKCNLSTKSHVIMISEGSCDTENWRNDAECSALHHRNKLHCSIYSNRIYIYITVLLNSNNICTILMFLLCVWSNKCSLGEYQMSLKTFFFKSYWPPPPPPPLLNVVYYLIHVYFVLKCNIEKRTKTQKQNKTVTSSEF